MPNRSRQMRRVHRRVLLVDDDPGLLRLLSMRLEAAGYDVSTASSGGEALTELGVSRPQVMITDLRMQGMDGMALFQHVHSQDPALPVIVLTAYATTPDAAQATQQGVFGYMTKPFDAGELLALIQRAIIITARKD
jgi:two-component system response regulator GlrR